jgi:uncharacterized pyridoxamine 5'-phosphate oxidase family protein
MNKPQYIPVKDNPNLVRDSKSKAILAINVDAQTAYRKQREERLKVKKMLDEFPTLQNDISEIKELLKNKFDILS